ncbi:hypothetical protein [Alkanindiges illinoisensis]|uniref:Uncharacterized protein n=1 Tax=Alkanindiges illinoisensis TaxID=197183 RepID=A0A4Y7X8X6_9GAMM|nr:hypothetical protein [Alkanindiges illinoisensis]TEU23365.1 hypothetical protein E2B99_13700 [Alkanindiges illinoisensis]
MPPESILITVAPENDTKIFKWEITVSELEHKYEIALFGFFPNTPLQPDPINLNKFITSRIEHDYKEASYPEYRGTIHECHTIICRKNAKLLHQLVLEIVDYIHSKVGDFKSIAYQGTNHYLNFDTLKVKFPDIERK